MTCILTLLLGATTSVAVAWVFAMDVLEEELALEFDGHLYHEFIGHSTQRRGIWNLQFNRVRPSSLKLDWAIEAAAADDVDAFLPAWSDAEYKLEPHYASYVEQAAGWPWLCLKSETHDTAAFAPSLPNLSYHTSQWEQVEKGIRLGAVQGGYRLYRRAWVLPTQPIWAGFIFNTLFWSLPWLVLISLISLARLARLHLRRKRNRCRSCGYRLQGLPALTAAVCPECGWDQRHRLTLVSKWIPCLQTLSLIMLNTLMVGVAMFGVMHRAGPEAIHLAALTGDTATVERLLDNGVSIEHPVSTGSRHTNGMTPLMWAAVGAQDEMVDLLIKRKADVHAISVSGKQPIHYAALQSSVKVMQSIVEAGADIDYADHWGGMTPLHQSISAKFGPTVSMYLIEQGANPDICAKLNSWNMTPLTFSIYMNEYELAAAMVERGAYLPMPCGRQQAIDVAVEKGPKYVKLLLENGYDIQQSATSDLMCLAIGNKESAAVIRLLAEEGVPPNINKLADSPATPLFVAIERNDLPAFKALLDVGAEVVLNSNRETILFASRNGFRFEYWWDEPEWIAFLDTIPLQVNRRNSSGETALVHHVLEGNVGAVRFLLDQGASANMTVLLRWRSNPDNERKRAIDFVDESKAAPEEREQIRQLLLEAMKMKQ